MTGLEARSESLDAPKSEFVAKLEARWNQGLSVCVGLDTDVDRLPNSHELGSSFSRKNREDGLTSMARFNFDIIDATHDLVSAYKPNSSFYEAHTSEGFKILEMTVDHIRSRYPEIPVIWDAKRGDIGNTNIGYVKAAFDELKVDAITVNPYLGGGSLKPFFDRSDRGILVLARTSNPEAGELQDLPVDVTKLPEKYKKLFGDLDGLVELTGETVHPVYEIVAYAATKKWNINGNVGLVVGATYPQELSKIRQIAGNVPFLIPGIGTQGGEVESTVTAGQNDKGQGMIINSSRGVLYASNGSNFAEAARAEVKRLTKEIDQFRKSA